MSAGNLADRVARRLRAGGRFVGLLARDLEDNSAALLALVAIPGRLELIESRLPPGRRSYEALTPQVPAADLYERQLRQLGRLDPWGHPCPEPLGPGPGATSEPGSFTISYGLVRSGVFESVEFQVRTRGEDILGIGLRPLYKRRAVEERFVDCLPDEAVLAAERVEGTCSVAHALALCQAVEALAGAEVPPAAEAVRLVHAELERIAVHLDSVIRQAEAAGQAVAFALFTRHKEELMRLRARLCGHRFSRGVVVPGGVSGPPSCSPAEALATVSALEAVVAADAQALMASSSFVDRLLGTGVLITRVVADHGAVGPLARASGVHNDVRTQRPYGPYRWVSVDPVVKSSGDALARQAVRLSEVAQSFQLVRRGLQALERAGTPAWATPLPPVSGITVSSVEAPQGELVYVVKALGGRLEWVGVRTASFHNLALFPQAFAREILTDFAFVEASFGHSIAGVAG